jgi:hypothetical protein
MSFKHKKSRNLLVAERYVYLPTAHARAAGAGSLLEMGRCAFAGRRAAVAAAVFAFCALLLHHAW